jgi:hypothetical protein
MNGLVELNQKEIRDTKGGCFYYYRAPAYYGCYVRGYSRYYYYW